MTAAVTVSRTMRARALCAKRSMKGAPARMKRKLGTKVTHDVINAPSVPMAHGGRGDALFHPARNPAKASTLTKGPGRVSAKARPSFMAPAESQPASFTA